LSDIYESLKKPESPYIATDLKLYKEKLAFSKMVGVAGLEPTLIC
jgi:hypothetical protein